MNATVVSVTLALQSVLVITRHSVLSRWLSLAIASFAALGLDNQASGISITVNNAGFEDVSGFPDRTPSADVNFLLDNTHAQGVAGSYSWTETDLSNVATEISGIYVINVHPNDFANETPTAADDGAGSEAGIERIALNLEGTGRVQQTTSHAISPVDTSFTLTLDVGNELNSTGASGYRGYSISLYAFNSNSNVKTFLKTIASTDPGAINPVNGAWATLTLSLTPADVDFSLFEGQSIGISLAWLNSGIYNTRSTFVDNVALEFTATPEPSGILLAGLGGLGLLTLRRRHTVIAGFLPEPPRKQVA